MKLLVLAGDTVDPKRLQAAAGDDADPASAEVMVLAPALQESPLKFWMSDADEAIARAEEVRRTSVEELEDAGVTASGQTGEADPVTAIRDALQTFPADRIVLLPSEGATRYREDVDARELEQQFGIPVSELRG